MIDEYKAQLIKTFVLIIICGLFVACTSTPRYYWADYPDGLYQFYNQPAAASRVRTSLHELIENAESKNLVIAPGIYAELGTYYLESGDMNQAVFYYQKEHDYWPESAAFMQMLISNLQRRIDDKLPQ